MKTFLVIDTATKESSLTLIRGNILLSQIILEERNQTKEIVPAIKKILLQNEITLTDISGIGICIGPGFYTGTRIGVMTAKTISFSLKIPLYPFSTFDLFDHNSPYAILDAKCERSHLYHKGNINLIPNSELKELKDSTYYINENHLKIKSEFLIPTNKNILQSSASIFSQDPLSHNELKIYYPEEIKNN